MNGCKDVDKMEVSKMLILCNQHFNIFPQITKTLAIFPKHWGMCYDCVNIVCDELASFARGLMTQHIAVSTPFPYHLRTHPLHSLCKLCSHCKCPI